MIDPEAAAGATLETLALGTFPAALSADVLVVLGIVGRQTTFERPLNREVVVDGERLNLMGRLYRPEPPARDVARLTDLQQQILSALYSHHYDGYVRERHLDRLFRDVGWTLPFVLLLVSDYVFEIAARALAFDDPTSPSAWQAFAAENPAFMRFVRQHVISHWSEHSRPWYPNPLLREQAKFHVPFRDYPGYQFLAVRGLWNDRAARRLLRKGPRP
jgi:hypothetical protein